MGRISGYDLAVIGAGLGGLAAAALASRKGRRVIVLEPSGTIGGSLSEFKKEGFTFYTGPAITFGAEQGGVLQRLYADHGIAHSARLASPCYQVLLPDRRITIYPKREATFEELRREFPGEMDKISGLYGYASKISARAANSRIYLFLYSLEKAGRHVKRYGFSRELFQFFNIQSLFFFRQPLDAISLSSLALLLITPPMQMRGGFLELAHKMLDVMLQNRGEVRYNESWPGLVRVKGRTAALETASGRIEARAILFNTPQVECGETIFMGLSDDVIPVGMADDVISISDYEKPEELLYLSISGLNDEAAAPIGMRALSASRPVIHSGRLDGDAVSGHLERIIPFLKEYIFFIQVHKPMERNHPFEAGIRFRHTGLLNSYNPLMKTYYRNVYAIDDDAGMSSHAIISAKRMCDRVVL